MQDDRAHAAKVEAFLDWFLAGAPAGLASDLRRLFAAWNSLLEPGPDGSISLPDPGEWTRHCRLRRDQLAAQHELTGALLDFVASKR